MLTSCIHPTLLVDYHHPHGTIAGVALADLLCTAPESARPCMTVSAPRCAVCHEPLTRHGIGARIGRGGDLYDPRVIWDV